MQKNFVYAGYPDFLRELRSLAEEPYAQFQRRLVPGEKILGVRMPKLRALAKQIAKGDWRRFLADARDDTLEETMVQSLVIGGAGMEYREALARAAEFVPKIKSWAACDVCASSFRFLKQNPERSFAFLEKCLAGGSEFSVRFAVTLMAAFFMNDGYLARLFAAFDRAPCGGYYAKMAVAWAVSSCFVKYPERTAAYLRRCRLDDWTYNKSLQKIVESRRVDRRTKETIRSMKRTNRHKKECGKEG